MISWYFPETNNPKNTYVDKFADSKFTLNKWNSFAREIIQNSLDVFDKDSQLTGVQVDFSYKSIPLSKIPGGYRLKDILSKCLEIEALNHTTKNAYQNGYNKLGELEITCLKISDYNTLGVETGLDKSWGALVYDEGISCKVRPGSAGSHGVGKKVPFIVSGVNTVFYCTKNSTDTLFQGKTSLVNWHENGKSYDLEGWYGNIDLDNPDRRLKVTPINLNEQSLDSVDEFFIRKEKKGTDVILLCVDLSQFEDIRYNIINAVIENFFVAINTNKLSCNVFGVEINSENLENVVDNYHNPKGRNFGKLDDYKIYNGNLKDYYRVYIGDDSPKKIDLSYKGISYGYAEIYFDNNNEKNKKYYCLFREHGMKIMDVQISEADQPYTATVIIKNYEGGILKEEEKINSILANRENAAHDEFVINDEQNPCDEKSKALITSLFKEIKNYIVSQTRIEISEEMYLEGLSDMLSISGQLNPSVRRSTPKLVHKKKKIKKKGMGKRAKNYEEGVTGVGGTRYKPTPSINPGQNKPAKEGNDFKATLYENFTMYPQFFHLKEEYILKFVANNNIDKADLKIMPVSVDGKITKIDNIIEKAYIDDKEYSIKDNIIKNVKLKSGKLIAVKIKLKNNLDYVLECDVYVEDKYA